MLGAMYVIKWALKKFLPPVIFKSVSTFYSVLVRKRQLSQWKNLQHLSPGEAFGMIYQEEMWGEQNGDADVYYSGGGSHREEIVGPYVTAIENFVKLYGQKLDAVDLGCGDFAVGGRTRHLFNSYNACDAVESIIVRNTELFKNSNVNFSVTDLTTEELPHGDIAIIRQVLQHLSNNHIKAIIPKLYEYKYVLVTEVLPKNLDFTPNEDIPTGFLTRLAFRQKDSSGVVVTQPPFNLKVRDSKTLCEVEVDVGVIKTILYVL